MSTSRLAGAESGRTPRSEWGSAPTAWGEEMALAESPESTEPPPAVNVLLVDDQPSNLLALEAILSGQNLNLVRVGSGEEALLRLLDDDFAVILMDVQMPDMDGFETAELIRGRDRSRHTPILFLTAFQSTEEQIHRGYALGAVDFLSKPIVPTVLRSKVAVFVELFLKNEQVKRQAAHLVENQRLEHQRALIEERRRWEMDRLRAEAAKEKRVAEALAQKAEELTRSIEERLRAEEQLRHRAVQQEIVARLGQRALTGVDLQTLLDEAVRFVALGLGVAFARVLEITADDSRLLMRASIGWQDEDWSGLAAGVATGESLAARTLTSTEPVVLEDLRPEAGLPLSTALREHEIVSGLSVSIPCRERTFGTLEAFSDQPRTFSRDDVHFVQAVTNVLAEAIQRQRDEHALKEVRDRLAIQLADMTRLHGLSERLSNSIELTAVLNEVLSAVIGLQGSDRGILLLLDRDRNELRVAATKGFDHERHEALKTVPLPAQLDRSAAALICRGVMVADLASQAILPLDLTSALGTGSQTVCGTPLLTCGGELVGIIATFFAEPYRASEREIRLLELYARQASEAIDNARLYREIHEADRRKGEFLAMLGHELRNPLAAILNALHVMRMPTLDREVLENARQIAEWQSRHLARLVDDLLDISRINSGKIELRTARIDLRDVISRTVETARPFIETRRHALAVAIPDVSLPLEADPARLEQILSNLLNNAAKYTEPGGELSLTVERDRGELIIKVRDNGIGIDADLLPRVFDLFTQAETSLDRSEGGLGIGLTLVHRLVQMHGGRVAAHSEGRGRGSEFTIVLPAAAPVRALEGQDPAEAPSPTEFGEARFCKVLLVDDNVDATRVLAQFLRENGYHVDVVHDGPTALSAVQEDPPSVVLLDIGLPGMDGYEVARRLRAQDILDRMMLVAFTGYGQEADRLRALEVGFDHYLVKPVDPEVVRSLLAHHHCTECDSLESCHRAI